MTTKLQNIDTFEPSAAAPSIEYSQESVERIATDAARLSAIEEAKRAELQISPRVSGEELASAAMQAGISPQALNAAIANEQRRKRAQSHLPSTRRDWIAAVLTGSACAAYGAAIACRVLVRASAENALLLVLALPGPFALAAGYAVNKRTPALVLGGMLALLISPSFPNLYFGSAAASLDSRVLASAGYSLLAAPALCLLAAAGSRFGIRQDSPERTD